MSSTQTQSSSTAEFTPPLGIFAPAMNYLIDAAQRSVLFWDVMRQRGKQYREHMAQAVPHVLHYDVELVVDGEFGARIGIRLEVAHGVAPARQL